LHLSIDAAESAFAQLSEAMPSKAETLSIAAAAISLAVSKMAGAVREISVHRGFDPREFVLMPFGGAGPMHAFLVADELGMRRVVIPPFPGHVSALGQMCADYRRDFSAPLKTQLSDEELAATKNAAEILTKQGHDYLESEHIEHQDRSFTYALDLRYAGQSFTMPIAWNPGGDRAADIAERFHERHQETFAYASKDIPIQVTSVRLIAFGRVDKPPVDFAETYAALTAGNSSRANNRRVFDGENWLNCRVIDRATCEAGTIINGPAIIEDFGATSYMPPGWVATVHASTALVCEMRMNVTADLKKQELAEEL
jgi:N-methylhydantoinase A